MAQSTLDSKAEVHVKAIREKLGVDRLDGEMALELLESTLDEYVSCTIYLESCCTRLSWDKTVDATLPGPKPFLDGTHSECG